MVFPSLAVQLGVTPHTRPREALLDVLHSLATEGVCEVTICDLAASIGYSARTVMRALADLERSGHISRARQGWRGTWVYEVHRAD